MQLRRVGWHAIEVACRVRWRRARMRGVMIFLGLLLLLVGGAVAAAQYVPVDLSPYLSSVPGRRTSLNRRWRSTPAAARPALGLLLMIIGLATGGSKKPEKRSAPAPKKASPAKAAAPEPSPRGAAAEARFPARSRARATTPAGRRRTARLLHRPAPSRRPRRQPPASRTAPTWTQDPRLLNRKRVSDLVIDQ